MKPTLLVVEDEILIRLDFVDLAKTAGFETLEAGDAAEALHILNSRSDIRVVFTDIRMPGEMDGLDLAHQVRERWPPTIIVICSGNEPPDQDALPLDATFMPKPCTRPKVEQLLSEIRASLN